MGAVTPEQAEVLRAGSEPWLAELLAKGGYVGWLCHRLLTSWRAREFCCARKARNRDVFVEAERRML